MSRTFVKEVRCRAGKGSNVAYWAGVTMGIACVAIMIADHSFLAGTPELAGIPLEWLTGSGAILAILAHELMDSAEPKKQTGKKQTEKIQEAPDRVA